MGDILLTLIGIAEILVLAGFVGAIVVLIVGFVVTLYRDYSL